ncbi:MAG TPA: peptidylprolyl isomerase [Sedimenticola thiotaurini]|uniref:Periplasmic chaperone PpiD n=1 Tax=Sedimenticola thiotaurini TaxID=1543721 RepID=A0A831RQM5_9GAMM|nr:peptidylprolyl isomerase [Sedimenticola thiotaurini]
MLQDIRERAQGWIAWFIVILISVPFALWGIQSYLGGGSEPVVAKVDGQEITERDFDVAYRNFRERLRQQLGKDYRPELLDEKLLRKQVLDAMIRDRLIMQASEKMGLSAGDDLVRAAIMAIPSFQVNGRFDQQAYERSVRSRGLTPAGFEAQMRQALISEQLSKAVRNSEFATASELQTLVRLRLQKRDVDYLLLPVDRYLDQIQPGDDELRRYYDANQEAFRSPERVKLEYIELDAENIAKTLSVDDETLRGFYEQRKSEYITPGQRRASHILITVDEAAPKEVVEEARKKAEDILRRLRDGEDFATLARELSQDPGSASAGGDLGYFEKGVMDKAFDDVVFAMQEGDIEGPVRTPFGFHIIRLTGIRPEQGRSFDQVQDELRQAYLKNEAERLFYEYAERLADLAYEDPGSLQPAADALGVKTRTSDWLTRDGGEGILASPKVIGAAFSDDVLLEGNNSEPIEISPEKIVVLRVTDHEEAAVRPFDEVRQEVADRLRRQQAAEKAREEGTALLARLRAGDSLEQVAQEAGVEVVSREGVERDARDLPAALRRQLFRLPHPGEGKPVYGDAALPNGDFAVIALRAVRDGTMEDAGSIGGEEMLRRALERSRGEAYYRHLIENLRARADVEITKKEG